MIRIAIVGDYKKKYPHHASTDNSLIHASRKLNIQIESGWIETGTLKEKDLKNYNAIWIAPGSPYQNMENVLTAISYARRNNIPLIATCGGFQHVVIEYARNVLGHKEAHHAEYQPEGKLLFITPLTCKVKDEALNILLSPKSIAHQCYNQETVKEIFHCNYGLNPKYRSSLNERGLRTVGVDSNNEVRIFEIPENDFFVATLYLPQSISTPTVPHPLITQFIKIATKSL